MERIASFTINHLELFPGTVCFKKRPARRLCYHYFRYEDNRAEQRTCS